MFNVAKKNYFFVFSFRSRISINDWVEHKIPQTDSLKYTKKECKLFVKNQMTANDK